MELMQLSELEAAQIELSMAYAAKKLNGSNANTRRWARLLGRVKTLRDQAEFAAKINKIKNKK